MKSTLIALAASVIATGAIAADEAAVYLSGVADADERAGRIAAMEVQADISGEATVYLSGVTDPAEFAGRVTAIVDAAEADAVVVAEGNPAEFIVYLAGVVDAAEAEGRLAAEREQALMAQAAEIPFPVFTLEISQGEPVVERKGPLMSYDQCAFMVKQATADVQASYANTHPEGWVDENGAVWQFSDWNFSCEPVGRAG